MKTAWLILLLLVDPVKIGKVNTLKDQAKKAFQTGDFKSAITHYRTLTDSLRVSEDEINLNLAHAYFQLNDTVAAQQGYQNALRSVNRKYQSIAHQQLGTLLNRQGKFDEALASYKAALKADPANEEARYNYELLRKKMDEQKKQEQKQNQDQQKKDQQDQQKNDQQKNSDQKNQDQQKKEQEKKDQEKKDQQQKDQQQQEKDKKEQEQKEQKDEQQKNGEQKEEKQQKPSEQKENKELPPSVKEKLEEMKISEQKARMILEAMKNQEIQYLQQNKRKATKPKDKNKPDW
jgi:tetratricopeptide (TPR) repeat protein